MAHWPPFLFLFVSQMSRPTIKGSLLQRPGEEMRRSIAISAKPGALCHRRDACIYCVLRTLKKISINLILKPWAPEVGSQELSRRLLQLPISLLKFQRNGRNLSQSTRSGRITYNSTLRVCLISVLSHIFHVLWESRENC